MFNLFRKITCSAAGRKGARIRKDRERQRFIARTDKMRKRLGLKQWEWK